MSFELITASSTNALLANVVTVVGENVDAILIVAAGIAGVVLAFWVANAILGFFARRAPRNR